jgi:hypothetical protein
MPQRFLRPGITTSDPWNACSFPAQSFYVRILTLVDDFGRYDGRIPVLHSHCFALRHDVTREDTDKFLTELVEHGLVRLYRVKDKNYIQVLKWNERTRSDKSKYPDPPVRQRKAQDSAGFRSGAQGKDASLVPVLSHRPKPSSSALRFPADAGSGFKDLFGRWVEFRKGLGRKPKDWNVLFQEQLDWLSKHPREDWDEIISQSIRNGWQGLFKLSKQRNGAKPDNPKPLDPSKIDLPERFKSWAGDKYHSRKDEIMAWKTWADVPGSLRTEWWREEKAKLPISV